MQWIPGLCTAVLILDVAVFQSGAMADTDLINFTALLELVYHQQIFINKLSPYYSN